MRIERLITLSIERLQNDKDYIEIVQKKNRLSKIKKLISEYKANIERLKKNTTYENDYINFSKIDQYEIRIEELQKELKENKIFCVEKTLADLDNDIQSMELNGIIGLLSDPNYANILSTYAEEIGIPELKDSSFIKDLQNTIKIKNSIDSRIFAPYYNDSDTDEYDYNKEKNIMIEYIKRLIVIAKITWENYDYLNSEYNLVCKTLYDARFYVYKGEFCYYKDDYSYNIYDELEKQYGDLKHEVLMSLVQNDFYTQVSPVYVIATTVQNEGILIEKSDEGTYIRNPKMILASIIKTRNEEPFEDEFDEEEIDDNIYLSTFIEDEMSKEEKIELAAHYSKELLNPNYKMTPEEIEQIINMGPKL